MSPTPDTTATGWRRMAHRDLSFSTETRRDGVGIAFAEERAMSTFPEALRSRLLVAASVSLLSGACGGRTVPEDDSFDGVGGAAGAPAAMGAGGTSGIPLISPVPCVNAGPCVVGEHCSTSSGSCACGSSGLFACGPAPMFGKALVCIASSSPCPTAMDASSAIHARYAGCFGQVPTQGALEHASNGAPECCYAISIGCTGRPLEVESQLRVATLVRGAGWA